jgi:hypothetical protein
MFKDQKSLTNPVTVKKALPKELSCLHCLVSETIGRYNRTEMLFPSLSASGKPTSTILITAFIDHSVRERALSAAVTGGYLYSSSRKMICSLASAQL